jgi:hypothetical protein
MGRVYVIYGRSVLENVTLANVKSNQGYMITGRASNDYTGYSVSGTGDVNNDGFPDILIGAPGNTLVSGRSYLIYGAESGYVTSSPTPAVPSHNPTSYPTPNPTSYPPSSDLKLLDLTRDEGFSINGINDDDFTGYSVSIAGDINNDGYDDMVIGAMRYPSGTSIGRVYVIYGRGTTEYKESIDLGNLTSNQGFIIDGINSKDCTGWSVAGAGDVNNDSYADILIGAPYYPSDSSRGISFLIYGGDTINLTDIDLSNLKHDRGISITGINDGDFTGWSVKGASDVNKDGFDDFMIGAVGYPSNKRRGRVYLIYGNSSLANIDLGSLSSSQGITIDGIYDGDYVGASISSAGDINSDSYPDLMIASSGYPYGQKKWKSLHSIRKRKYVEYLFWKWL